jgi:hypothetical protein
MLFLVQAFVFLDLTLAAAPTPPEGATLLGTTDVVLTGVVVLTISRGTGQALRTFWTGYWTLTP